MQKILLPVIMVVETTVWHVERKNFGAKIMITETEAVLIAMIIIIGFFNLMLWNRCNTLQKINNEHQSYINKLEKEIDNSGHWVIPDEIWETKSGKQILAKAKGIEDSITKHYIDCDEQI